MKYLAILKDSLLEALDTKVFYAMVGLSCLVLLVVASVSYRPVAVEDEMRAFARNLTWLMGLGKQQAGDPPRVDVTDFRQTNPEAPPWEGNYRFTIVLRQPDAERGIGEAERQAGAQKLRQALRRQFRYLEELEVAALDSPEPTESRFEVTTRGTKVTAAKDWPHEPTLFFALPLTVWHAPVGNFVHFWEDTVVNSVGAGVALLVSVVITAFFIPNMLRKGTVDLLLVKPIRRSTLLLYKYVGGLAFMFLNTTFVVVGIWLILGLRTGLWGVGFLASVFVLTFQFAFYYAVSTLFGVLTRSAIVAILMSCLAWFLFSLVLGNGYRVIDATRKLPEIAEVVQEEKGPVPPRPFPDWVYTSADVVHFVTPRLKDLDTLTNKLIVDDTLPEFSEDRRLADKLYAGFRWGEALAVTALYIVALLGLSCWRFTAKEY